MNQDEGKQDLSFFQVSRVHAGAQAPGLHFIHFPGALAGIWMGSGADRSLKGYATTLSSDIAHC